MANKFEIVITGVDKMSAMVDKINQRMEKVLAPVKKVQQSMNRLSTSIARNPIAKFLKGIGHATQFVYRGMTSLLNPFFALIGASSIAGVAALANQWGKFGYNIMYAARQMGMGTTQLQQFMSAAALLYMDKDAAAAALGGLGQHIFDAQRTGNQEVDSLLAKLKMNIKHTPTGEVDSLASLRQIADAFQNNPKFRNYQLRNSVESALGITDLAPALNAGSKGIDAAMAQGQMINPANTKEQLAARNELYKSMAKLDESLAGLNNTIANDMVPPLKRMADFFSSLVAKNSIGVGHGLTDTWNGLGKMFVSGGTDTDQFQQGIASLLGRLPGIASANNNPTLMEDWHGTNGIANFKTPGAGLLHAAERLRYLGASGLDSISNIMGVWDKNDPDDMERNIQDVSRVSGYDKDQHLNLGDPATLATMLHAMSFGITGRDSMNARDFDTAAGAAAKEPIDVILHVEVTGGTANVHAKSGARVAHAMSNQ